VDEVALHPFRLVVLAVAGSVVLGAAMSLARRRRRRQLPNPPAAAPCPKRPAPGSRSEQVLALFGALRAGDRVGGWRIVEIYEDDRGCVPVLLAGPDGREFRIDVQHRDPQGPPPPAETEKLGLYLAGTQAGTSTPEDRVRGARALAAALGAVGADPPAWLLTMRERAPLLATRKPA
jgi:hypothetical protein